MKNLVNEIDNNYNKPLAVEFINLRATSNKRMS